MTTLLLSELACPCCGHRGSFHIDVTATAYVDASGPCVESEYYWNADSNCTCLNCFHDARVADFRSKAVQS